MPALIKYERKPLTMSQLYAVRDYIARRKLGEQDSETLSNGVSTSFENGTARDEGLSEIQAPATPPPPSAQEIREQKQQHLKDLSEQLVELERTLEGLKKKKHELFEEIKSLLSSENESKRQAEERDRQLHSFSSPFVVPPMAQGPLMNLTPYRPVVAGMKRPKSPSPPLVQLYSPGHSSSMQPSYNTPHGPSAVLGRPPHLTPALGTHGQGDIPRSQFQPMGGTLPGNADGMLPGYVFQQNVSSRDPRQQVHGSQVNRHPSATPQTPGTHYTSHERQFVDQRHLHERSLRGMASNVARGVGLQNIPRQAMINQSPFMQQNMLPGQQQGAGNTPDGLSSFSSFGKEHPGFGGPALHRPQSFITRGGHPPNRSRYY